MANEVGFKMHADLLSAPTGPGQYIAHVVNCLATEASGLSKAVFETYPEANVYTSTHANGTKGTPGTIVVHHPVINMYAQVGFGAPAEKSPVSKDGKKPLPSDTEQSRKGYFKRCLEEMAIIKDLKRVTFPWLVGCGMGGGDWKAYEAMIQDFATANPHITVFIYRYE